MIELQQPYRENKQELIGELLFRKENITIVKETLHTFWKIRYKHTCENN